MTFVVMAADKVKQYTSFECETLFDVTKAIIVKELNALIATESFCKCVICLNDITAYALMHLPSCYATNMIDYTPSLGKVDNYIVVEKLKEAIIAIGQNPHH